MSPMKLALVSLLLPGCHHPGAPATPGGGRPLDLAGPGNVAGELVIRSPALEGARRLELQSGVVFADLDNGGALTLALASWPGATCDVGRWALEGPPEQARLVVSLEEDGAALNYAWATGGESAAGSLDGAFIELQGDGKAARSPESRLQGDLVLGSGAEVEVVARFSADWCGATGSLSPALRQWVHSGRLLSGERDPEAPTEH